MQAVYHIKVRGSRELVYVGRTNDPKRRWVEHQYRYSADMYRFKTVTRPMLPTNAARREMDDIRRLGPRDNVIGAWMWRDPEAAAAVAQWLEQATHNRPRAGSIPARRTPGI